MLVSLILYSSLVITSASDGTIIPSCPNQLEACNEAIDAADKAINAAEGVIKTQNDKIKVQQQQVDELAKRTAELEAEQNSLWNNKWLWLGIGAVLGGALGHQLNR